MSNPTDPIKRTIRKLTKRQREVFDRICINHDECVPLFTGKRLEELGLVNIYLEPTPGYPPISIYRYDVASPSVHIAWCELCAEEQPNE